MFTPLIFVIVVDSKIEQVSTDIICQVDPIVLYPKDETQFTWETEFMLNNFWDYNIVEHHEEHSIRNQTASNQCSRIFESNFKFEE